MTIFPPKKETSSLEAGVSTYWISIQGFKNSIFFPQLKVNSYYLRDESFFEFNKNCGKKQEKLKSDERTKSKNI